MWSELIKGFDFAYVSVSPERSMKFRKQHAILLHVPLEIISVTFKKRI